jgi:hypothetical protein
MHYRNRALFRVLGAFPSAFYRTLGKVLLTVTTAFTESNTLDTKIHSTKKSLPSGKHSANDSARQRAVSSRYLCRAPSFGTRQRSFFAECPAYDTRQSMLCRVPSLDNSTKYILFFSSQLNFLWYVSTLCRLKCSILTQL